MTEEGRQSILQGVGIFLFVPVIMWVDMMIRLASLINVGMKSASVGK